MFLIIAAMGAPHVVFPTRPDRNSKESASKRAVVKGLLPGARRAIKLHSSSMLISKPAGSPSSENPMAEEYAVSVNNAINKAKTDVEKQKIKDNTTANFGGIVGGALGSAAFNIPLGWADLLTMNEEAVARGQITEKNVLSPFQKLETYNEDISQELNQKGSFKESIPVIGGMGFGDSGRSPRRHYYIAW